MILRFTDGQHHISFNTTWKTWNDLVTDSAIPADPAVHPLKFIEVSEKALAAIMAELDFNCYGYSDDLHHELVIPDEVADDEIPLF